MANDDILSTYLKEISKIPLLTREEENELALKAKNGDKAAREKIASANLRFVVNIAKKYRHSGMDMTDLISEGNVGLMTAIDKFDASKGCHFISYAVWWIRQSILKAIYEKKDAIRLPLNRVNELVKIKKAKKAISSRKTEEEEIREIAASLNMESETVRDLLNISREMISLDATVQGGSNEESAFGRLGLSPRLRFQDFLLRTACYGGRVVLREDASPSRPFGPLRRAGHRKPLSRHTENTEMA